MPDIEEMLLGDDEENPKPDNAAYATMRKELKALRQEAEELRAYKAQAEEDRRRDAVAEVFRSIGLKPKHAKFYPTDGEPTEEAVKIWAIAEELIDVEEGEEPPAPTTGFTPTVIAEGSTPAIKRYTRAEFEEGMRQNPEKWAALAEAGRVKWNNL